MTTRTERTVELQATPDDVWELLSDPKKTRRGNQRRREIRIERRRHPCDVVSLAADPGIDETVAIETEDTTRDPHEYIKFIGQSKLMHVIGEHNTTESDPTRVA